MALIVKEVREAFGSFSPVGNETESNKLIPKRPKRTCEVFWGGFMTPATAEMACGPCSLRAKVPGVIGSRSLQFPIQWSFEGGTRHGGAESCLGLLGFYGKEADTRG